MVDEDSRYSYQSWRPGELAERSLLSYVLKLSIQGTLALPEMGVKTHSSLFRPQYFEDNVERNH